MRANLRFSRTNGLVLLSLAVGSLLIGGAAASGNGWGNDREADFNDAQCDDDEGTGNDWKCTGAEK